METLADLKIMLIQIRKERAKRLAAEKQRQDEEELK
jgi:hypothetical protein